MRVLYLTPGCFDKGGISRYCRYQISALRDLFGRDSVDVYSLAGHSTADFEEPFEVAWHGSRGFDKCRPVTSAEKLSYAMQAFGAAVRRRPDVVLCAHVNFSSLAVSIAKLAAARSVLNVYGMEVWSGLRSDAEWGLRRVGHVIADCHFTARYIEEQGHRAAGSAEVAWDCVDTSKFFPASPRRDVIDRYGIPDPSTGINVLTLGRMSRDCRHKGYERLLAAFARVARQVPQLRLVFAGRGNLVEDLRRAAEKEGLADRVFFTGMVAEADLPDVYRSSHLFSLVSDRGVGRGEGIPLTPLEASACGLPILVGNQDGSQEAVVGETNGYVLDPFDLDTHAQRLVRLGSDADLRAQMSTAGLERIRHCFAYPVFRERHARLWTQWFSTRTGRDAAPRAPDFEQAG